MTNQDRDADRLALADELESGKVGLVRYVPGGYIPLDNDDVVSALRAPGEMDELYERLNMAEDLLGDALAYLESPENYTSGAGIIEQLQSYFEFKESGRAALAPASANEVRKEASEKYREAVDRVNNSTDREIAEAHRRTPAGSEDVTTQKLSKVYFEYLTKNRGLSNRFAPTAVFAMAILDRYALTERPHQEGAK